MIMLYALSIETEAGGQRIERIIINPKDIKEFYKVPNPRFPFVIYAYKDKISYRIELKPNNNFNNIIEFFDYIRDYSEICFETKEVPTKKEIKVGDVYQNGDTFILILGVDNFDVSAIRYEFDEIIDYNKKINKHFIWREWLYIGNNETAAYNITAGFNDFRHLIKEKGKDR